MSNRTRAILIVLAGVVLIILGIIAVIQLSNRISNTTQAAQAEGQTVKNNVVVLARDVSLGDMLEASDLTVSQVPVDLIPRDAISSIEDAVGKFVKTDMVQGEMLLEHNLATPTTDNHDLTYVLSEDHVLMAFPATDLMSRESVVQRGDIVDILATFQETVKKVGETQTTTTTTATANEGEVNRTFTIDAFQKVSITAMVMDVVSDNSTGGLNPQAATNRAEETISSYLLALNPQDALVLKHLKDMGATFDIVIRAPTSTVQFDLTPVTEEYIVELYGLEILP